MTTEQLFEEIQKLDERERVELATKVLNADDIYFASWMPQDLQYQAAEEGHYLPIEQAREELQAIIDNHDAGNGINWDIISDSIDTSELEDYDEEIHKPLINSPLIG